MENIKMIFADKLIELRKKAGLTQEELAEKMNVSRQAIAKWEGMQSVPELSKMIKLSELFGVSTDYLLKDEVETDEAVGDIKDTNVPPLRRVSMEEANAFLASRRKAARPMATATFLCIISPIVLIFLGCLSEVASYNVGENAVAGFGMSTLVVLVAAAVATFISVGNKNSQYAYLEKEMIDTEYGVDGMVKELRSRFKPTYDKCNVIGVVLCIVAILPIFAGVLLDENNPLVMGLSVCLLLLLAAIAVYTFVRVGVVWASYDKLLQAGDYTKEKKEENNSIVGAVSSAYWLIVTAVYLAISFATDGWDKTWIIWAVAGVCYPALLNILRATCRKDK